MSAVQQALNTRELLSLVLTSLDQRTLLVSAQRVCRDWRHEIQSPLLRHHLFLESLPGLRARDKVLNPLLAEVFPHCFRTPPSEPTKSPLTSGAEQFDAESQFARSKLYSLRGQDSPFLREDASWLVMHVSDPPTIKVAWHRVTTQRWSCNETQSKIFPDGLRMRDLYLLVLGHGHVCCQGSYTYDSFMALWPHSQSSVRSADVLASSGKDYRRRAWREEADPYQEIDEMSAEMVVQLAITTGCTGDKATDEQVDFWRDCGLSFGPFIEEVEV